MRVTLLAALVCSAIASSSARAQDDAALASEEASPPPEEAIAEGGEDETWELPTIMIVPQRDTPEVVVSEIERLVGTTGTLVDADGYEREARSRGLPADTAEAMAAVLPEMHADLDLVVVVGVNRASRATLVLLRFHDRFGLEMLEEEHSIQGGVPTEESAGRILAETRLALAVITRPPGGLRQVEGGVTPGERTPGLAVHIGALAGIGFGTREFEVPAEFGIVSLGAAIFPAAALALGVEIEPTARGQLTVSGRFEYQTSLGLVTTDRRVDGTERETGSRSQLIAAGLGLAYRLGESLDTVSLEARLAWVALSFTSEAPVSLPDYTLQGPALSLGVSIPIADRLFTLELFPEARLIVDVGALGTFGVSSTGGSIGGTAAVRLRMLPELFAELAYRESHAFLDAPRGGATDVERFATVRVFYRP